ncbi:MAG: 50S ribosomal protein L18 [Candidatus Omnitrophica bacterium CG07_land_8_20_14_0_80_50_8]|nr:MAG: 50S ribosomal protein L18 [Candidatus Omnitrophica bacterium CG1_02_49_16]PIU40260.1 MAG: 50S ribosomal protein L18 [Candidatus Omnitrophica bacterium CG07_land_8_20_14_0_80_50_8]
MISKNRVKSNRIIRHFRIRKRVRGNANRPRLSVYPSLQHFEAQIIDDFEQKTLAGFSTKAKEFKKISGLKTGGNVAAALCFGKFVAEQAKAKGIKQVVFDRGGFLYHGRVKAFADAAREQGLSF